MTDAKKPPAKKTAAAKKGLAPVPEATEPEPSLADVADAGLQSVPEPEGPSQGVFENTDYTKVTFVGANYQSLEYSPRIGEEVEFIVKGRVKAVGDEKMASGFIRHMGKVEVTSILMRDED